MMVRAPRTPRLSHCISYAQGEMEAWNKLWLFDGWRREAWDISLSASSTRETRKTIFIDTQEEEEEEEEDRSSRK